MRWFPVMVALGLGLGSGRAQVEISEFMASNTKGLKDDFGRYEDWIEIHNYSATTLNLGNWILKNGGTGEWRFPDTNMTAGSYLVVFASNRNRQVAGLPLHTNFRLSRDGEYLALLRPDRTVATEFQPAYPAQLPDVSFGVSGRSTGQVVVGPGSSGRVRVPREATTADWVRPEFDDGAWGVATNGIGFEEKPGVGAGTIATDILADDPAGYWRLDETGGTVKNSARNAGAPEGKLLGGVTPGVAGPRPGAFAGFEPENRAVRCNGVDGRIEVAYAPELNPDGFFTVEAWAKPARSGGGTAWLFSSLDLGAGRSGYALAQDYSAKKQWEFRLGDSGGYIAMAYGGVVDTNRWQYLAGVYDGATARLYVDGALVATAALTRAFAPNRAQKTVIGCRIDTANPYYFAGDVDEVSVCARALSAGEIATRFARAVKGVGPVDLFQYAGLIQTDLRQDMWGVNSSVFLRLPFVLANVEAIDGLTLRMKYEDGFVAWLDGVYAAGAGVASGSSGWNAVAAAPREPAAAREYETFDLRGQLGTLREGTNVLALQGLNLTATDPSFLLVAELETSRSAQRQLRYFLQPTPGGANGTSPKDQGPILGEVGHSPERPGMNDRITVTCRVAQAWAPVANVTLNWRVMFDPLAQTPMFDDGRHGDGAAGDGIYGATIPSGSDTNGAYAAGQMVRWYVTAVDSLARASRWPLFPDPAGSAEYLGTVAQPDYVTSPLPVFQFFAPPTVLHPGPSTPQSGADSEQGGRVALYYDGEFYDNIYMEVRGNTSAGLNKKAHRLEFNREHPFRHPGPGGRVLKTSLLAEMLDPAYLRQHLCFWLLDLMGVGAPFDYPVRAQLNGAFYQLAFHSDVLGSEQLERLGYDPEGALYKCVGRVDTQFSSTGGFQKLLPTTNLNSRADYLQLAQGISETLPPAARRTNVFDLLDVPQVINYLAGARFCAENDDVWANMCLYRDTSGDGLWRIVPYDMNASWGQLYGGSSPLQATNDNGKSHPFYGGSQVQEGGGAAWNRIYDVIIALPETRDMLRRRERTLLDRWVFPPGLARTNYLIESHILQMSNLISAEAALDRQKWGTSPWAGGQSFAKGITDLLNQFVGPRRSHWYVTHSITNTAKPLGLGSAFNAGIPLSQPEDAVISFASWETNPGSDRDGEYFCLTNANNYAVDMSGWKVDGGIRHTFRPGTVITAGGVLYLSPNVAVFRARTRAPHGGMGLLVQGNYSGHISPQGEIENLFDPAGRLVSSATVYAQGPPRVEAPRGTLRVTAGGDARIWVSASGAPPLSYQWQFNGIPVAGATSNVFAITHVQPVHAGGYAAVVTNAFGSVTSAVSQLTVEVPAPTLAGVTWDGSSMRVSVTSWRGLSYVLESKDDLNEPVWTALAVRVEGTGGPLVLEAAAGTAPRRFYRVRAASSP